MDKMKHFLREYQAIMNGRENMNKRKMENKEMDKEISKIIVKTIFNFKGIDPELILFYMRDRFNDTPFLTFSPTYAETYLGYERKVIMHVLHAQKRLHPNYLHLLENEEYRDILETLPEYVK